MFIPDSDLDFSPILDPGSGSATLKYTQSLGASAPAMQLDLEGPEFEYKSLDTDFFYNF